MKTLTPQQRAVLAKAHKWVLDTADLVAELMALHAGEESPPLAQPGPYDTEPRCYAIGHADGFHGRTSNPALFKEPANRKAYERGYTDGRKKSYDEQPASKPVPEGEGIRAYVDPPTKLGGIAMPIATPTPTPKKRNGPIPCHTSYCKGYRDGIKGVTALPYADPLKQESYNRGQVTGRKTAAKLAEVHTPLEPTL